LIAAIDNIFMDTMRFSLSSTSAIVNGLSEHDAQYLVINNIASAGNLTSVKQRTRKVNDEIITQFQLLQKIGNLFTKIMIPTISLTSFCILV
jgi:hypothetical protein